jgi:hypothetical protein
MERKSSVEVGKVYRKDSMETNRRLFEMEMALPRTRGSNKQHCDREEREEEEEGEDFEDDYLGMRLKHS